MRGAGQEKEEGGGTGHGANSSRRKSGEDRTQPEKPRSVMNLMPDKPFSRNWSHAGFFSIC